MGLDKSLQDETSLYIDSNKALNDLLCFIYSSCWMSSANNLIWIFIVFVVLIALVSQVRFTQEWHQFNLKRINLIYIPF